MDVVVRMKSATVSTGGADRSPHLDFTHVNDQVLMAQTNTSTQQQHQQQQQQHKHEHEHEHEQWSQVFDGLLQYVIVRIPLATVDVVVRLERATTCAVICAVPSAKHASVAHNHALRMHV